mmetsp:Transcript_130356/g.377115  ORF Transcript_130356/g.377115 Transcript_130356/m.377115 type:complete len:90 (+) Transcript_130356:2-271(+)
MCSEASTARMTPLECYHYIDGHLSEMNSAFAASLVVAVNFLAINRIGLSWGCRFHRALRDSAAVHAPVEVAMVRPLRVQPAALIDGSFS